MCTDAAKSSSRRHVRRPPQSVSTAFAGRLLRRRLYMPQAAFTDEHIQALGPLSESDAQLVQGLLDSPVPPEPRDYDRSCSQSWAVSCLAAYL